MKEAAAMTINAMSRYVYNAYGLDSLFSLGNNASAGINKNNLIKPPSSSSYFNQSLYDSLSKIKTAANALKPQISSMAVLNKNTPGIAKAAEYSDGNVLQAAVAKNAAVSSYTKTSVTVTQLAEGQRHEGAALEAADNDLGGNISLDIKNSAGKTVNFNINLTGADNNKTALQKLADKINASDTGVKAALVEDKTAGTVALRLDSVKTGAADGKFTVTDTSAAGLGNTIKAAQDAAYTVNGTNFTSATNDVKLFDGVTAKLKQIGSTDVTYKTDYKDAANKVKGFLDTYNELLGTASNSPALQRQLTSLTSGFNRALGFAGVSIDAGGKLSVKDEGKLAQAIEDGSWARNFQGVLSFGNKLGDIANRAFTTAYSSSVFVNYNSINDILFGTSNQNGMSNWLNSMNVYSGLLFNMKV